MHYLLFIALGTRPPQNGTVSGRFWNEHDLDHISEQGTTWFLKNGNELVPRSIYKRYRIGTSVEILDLPWTLPIHFVSHSEIGN